MTEATSGIEAGPCRTAGRLRTVTRPGARVAPYRDPPAVPTPAEAVLATHVLRELSMQTAHRRALESYVTTEIERRARLGQVLAAGLVGLGIAGGVVVATVGAAPVAGLGFATAAFGSAALTYGVGGRAPGR